MFFGKSKAIFWAVSLMLALAAVGFAQNKPGDGSVTQRLEVMRQKLENVRRSLSSAATAFKEEDDKSKKENKTLDTPLSRIKALEKEASSLQSEVNSIRGKIDRSEKYEPSDVDQLETATSDIVS